jgi:AraC family transcriptional regulator, transcriptional activator of the genes for pyochelin and ferripyochelin receptors
MGKTIGGGGPRRHETAAGRRIADLTDEMGGCRSMSCTITDGIELTHLRYRPSRGYDEPCTERLAQRALVVTVTMSGQYEWRGHDGQNIEFSAGHTSVSAYQDRHGMRRYRGPACIDQLRLSIAETQLSRYQSEARCEALLGHDEMRQISAHRTSLTTHAHAIALLNLLSNGVRENPLDIHIQALGLLKEELNRLDHGAKPLGVRLTHEDLEKVEAARALMEASLERELPPAYLATAVGLNEFKLKAGFRHRFNTTPARMLFEMRMHRAKQLLEETGCQVAQAGWKVGYSHPCNFSVAFTRFFGKPPKCFLKLR